MLTTLQLQILVRRGVTKAHTHTAGTEPLHVVMHTAQSRGSHLKTTHVKTGNSSDVKHTHEVSTDVSVLTS